MSMNCISVFDHFVGLALKGLTENLNFCAAPLRVSGRGEGEN